MAERSCGGTRRAMLAAASLLLLAACDEPVQPDYTHRFAIDAAPETVTMTANFAGQPDPFAGIEGGGRFDTLVAGYLDRGHGKLTLSARPLQPNDPRARQQLDMVRGRLIAAGVPASTIQLAYQSTGAYDSVTLTYQRYDVVVPSCGDWSAAMAFNPANTDYPEFGCAIQHDLGLMIADPGDIAAMRQPAPSDPQYIERVIRDYRTGTTATETKPNSIQDNADQNVATGSAPAATSAAPAPTR